MGDEREIGQAMGGRIRQRRTELGLTQEQLAQGLGITYQQIQKYERGSSRITAVRLHQIATRLGVAISYFLPGPDAAAAAVDHGVRQRTAIELARSFAEIGDDGVRTAIAALARTVAEQATGRPAPAGA